LTQSAPKFHIFVYGTLMHGERNHIHMHGATYLGAVRTKYANYNLVEFASQSAPGCFTPGLLDGIYHIIGELYELDEPHLAALDEFEEEGVQYARKPVFLEDGSSAQTYFFIGEREFIKNPAFINTNEKQHTQCWVNASRLQNVKAA
jgi:gamma-glutamylcyclotransferase (GGCT)/AIG2-like uncharacterized protein YtfP